MNEVHVIATLAPARRDWVHRVAHWSTSGELPATTVTCLSARELRSLVGTGRAVSLVLVDSGTLGFDRDVVAELAAASINVVVVDDGRAAHDWDAIGCAEVTSPPASVADVSDLLDAYGRSASPRRRASSAFNLSNADSTAGPIISVTGTRGTTSAVIAMAIAQGLAAIDGDDAAVALIDGGRRATLTVLHAPDDVLPNLTDLVDAHRSDTLDPQQIRSALHHLDGCRYDVLTGIRRTRDWTALRPLALDAALTGVAAAYRSTVIEHDPDVDGSDSTGSVDVDERHALARWATEHADLVVLTGTPDVAGLFELASIRADLHDAGLPQDRTLTIVVAPQRSAALAASVHDIRSAVGAHPAQVIALGRRVELSLRAGLPLPQSFANRVTSAVVSRLDQVGRRPRSDVPAAVRPGELGTRFDQRVPNGEVA
ncbi:MAG: hypothetical protein ACKOYM_05885 [Actinomycetes bacterium]